MGVVEFEPALVVGPFAVDQYWMIDHDECRASTLHLLVYHFPQFFLIFPSLLPHFHCKTTQIITLGVIKHDQVSFANG